MDTKDLKQFLYAWLGKQKIGQPTYTISQYKRGNADRFKCEVRVPGFSFLGIGDSLNKKDAATNAAMDFCNFLVREGKLEASELPLLTAASLTTTNGCLNDEEEKKKTEWIEYRKTDNNTKNMGDSKSNFDKYVNQKAAEITQSENVDLKAEIHGGWTVENSKSALNEFFQRVRIPIPCYETHRKEAMSACSTFESRLTVFIPQINKSLSGFGDGSTKKVAESYCSMSIVRQLYHLGVMAEYKGVRRKTTSATLPAIPMTVDVNLAKRVNDYVIKAGVMPVRISDSTSITSDSPVSLIVNCKLTEFPDSEVSGASNVNWAPSLPNWDPWKGTNIDEAPLALMNMDQISSELLKREQVASEELVAKRQELPVAAFRQRIINTVKSNSVTLIKGETGCGKSTQVVQYLLESYVREGRGSQFNAIVSQPRRISAITLAERVSSERNEQIGNSIGYAVRFDAVLPRPYGSVLFCTVGVLLRRMEGGLRGISHIIIDEIHERDVNTDFVLIVLREMVREYPEIRLILMSATIDTELFTNYFGNCPVIEMHGRMHPVQHFFLEDVLKMVKLDSGDIKYVDNDLDEDDNDEKAKNLNLAPIDGYPDYVLTAMKKLTERDIPYEVIQALLLDINDNGEDGAVLIFLPGWSEIMFLLNMLNAHSVFGDQSRYVVLPLHSQLSSMEQRKVFLHYENSRKIILTTNIAETSVTIDDVVYVIDSCRAKERTYTSNNNMVHFATVWASRTNLAQRRGRAGRVRPGFAFHLCSRARYDALEEYRVPEMLRTPLHEVSLTVKLLRLGSVGDFLAKALQSPPVDMVIESEALLQSMGALDNNLELTPLGRILAHLPIEPVMGKTIVLASALGIGSLMCQLTAGSSFSSPFIQKLRIHTRLSGLQRSLAGNRWSDHIATVNASQQFELAAEQGCEISFCDRYSLSLPILKMISGARRQLVDVLTNQCGFSRDLLQDISINPESGDDVNLDLMTTLLITAFYPNIAFYRGKRKVYTLEQASALVNKLSILTPFKGDNIVVPSPLMVFTEKVRSRCIACKELTVISAIQLLLFGCRKIECIGENLVKLDDMITVNIPIDFAADIVALRPCIESLIVRTCMNPYALDTHSSDDMELKNLIVELSSRTHFSTHESESNYLLTKKAADHFEPGNLNSSRGRGRGSSQVSASNGFRGGRGHNRYQVSSWNIANGGGQNEYRNFDYRPGNPYNVNRGGGPMNNSPSRGAFRSAPYHFPNNNRGSKFHGRGRGRW